MRQLLTCLVLTYLLTDSSLLAQTTLFVAPVGKDSNPGTRQAPLATLAGARDRVRQVEAEKSADRSTSPLRREPTSYQNPFVSRRRIQVRSRRRLRTGPGREQRSGSRGAWP